MKVKVKRDSCDILSKQRSRNPVSGKVCIILYTRGAPSICLHFNLYLGTDLFIYLYLFIINHDKEYCYDTGF